MIPIQIEFYFLGATVARCEKGIARMTRGKTKTTTKSLEYKKENAVNQMSGQRGSKQPWRRNKVASRDLCA